MEDPAGKEVPQDDPALPQAITATHTPPEAQTTTDPGSSVATSERGVIDSSLAPELESLSSGSEPEDQFYEASEEPSVAAEQVERASEAVGTDWDEETGKGMPKGVKQKSDEGLASTVEEHDGGGMSKVGEDDLSSKCEQQHSVGSVDKEFVMVNYPSMTSDHSDPTKQPQVDQKTTSAMSPQDSVQQVTATSSQATDTRPIGGSGDTTPILVEGDQTVQLEDGNESSILPIRVEITGSSAQPENAESAQRLADDSQEVTGNLEGEDEGGQVEIEGELSGGSEVATERKSSDAEGEKGQVSARTFESLGLLYASSPNVKHNRDLMKPADEVAEDVLEAFPDIEDDSELPETPLSPDEGREKQLGVGYLSIDPGVMIEMERRAETVAAELSHVMDNLRNSLHAMTVCTKQSVQLHRESVDNLHSVVDTNIKGMYTFMAKFEELNKSLGPLQQIAAQIHDIDEKLRLLEQSFRVTSTKSSQVQSSIRTS